MTHPESIRPPGLLPSLPLPSFDRFDTKLDRQTRREVALIEANLAVRQTAVDAVGELQKAKVDVVGAVGERAMLKAAWAGHVQQQLVLACPASSGDLDVLKTLTVMGMGQVLADTVGKVNRL